MARIFKAIADGKDVEFNNGGLGEINGTAVCSCIEEADPTGFTISEPWIEIKEMPVLDRARRYSVKFRDGSILEAHRPVFYMWFHTGGPLDIVAYREAGSDEGGEL